MTDDKPTRYKVEVPSFLGFGGGTVIFSERSVQYQDKKFAYADIRSVSYSAMSTTLNFIPTDQIYTITFKTKKERMNITLETRLKIGEQRLQVKYQRLVSLSRKLIEPAILARYVRMIFEEGYTIEIHGVQVSKDGFKSGGRFTAWSEGFFLPEFERSEVVIYQDDAGRPQKTAAIPIRWDNACLLPDLFRLCASRVRTEPGTGASEPAQPAPPVSPGPFEVLALQPGASWLEIEAAYRAQAKLYHPDRVAGLAPEFIHMAEEKMKAINSAFEELKGRYGK